MKKIYLAIVILTTITSFAQTTCLSFTSTNYPSGSGSFSTIIDDFNGDGKKDFAGTTWGANNFYIYLGNGAGSFTTAAGSPHLNGSPLYGLTCGDFNGDGKKDIVVSSASFFQLYTGQGTGNFTPSTLVNFGTTGSKLTAVSADFNGDGKLDVAFSNAGVATVETFTGNGAGNFTPTQTYNTPSNTWGVNKGDFNADGRIDLLFSCASGQMEILLGTPSGTFTPSVFASGVASAAQVEVGDINGDGKLDFVVGAQTGSAVNTMLGNGAGGFASSFIINTPGLTMPYGVGLADFNMDGKLDVIANGWSSNNTGAYFGTGTGTFISGTTNPIVIPTVNQQIHIATGDFDGDSKPDAVFGAQSTMAWVVLLNKQISLTGPSVACTNSITLTASTSGSYFWTPGGMSTQAVSVLPASTTTYTVSGTFNGCTTTAMKTVSVGLPSLSVSSTNSVLCAGQTATLTASGATSYTWNSTSGSSMFVVTPTVTTTYTVIGGTGTCTSQAVYTQSVVICTGIAALKQTNGPAIAIYPNPNAGEFIIASNINMELSLINEIGQVVKTISLNESNNRKVQVNDLESGIYFVVDQNNKAVLRQKVVVTR